MDNNINIIKRYIEKKDYINLEEILSNFIIPTLPPNYIDLFI